MNRRLARTLAPLAAVGLMLTACGGSSEQETPSPSASSQAETGDSAAMPDISGDFGQVPAFSFSTEEPAEGLQVEVLSEGEGEIVDEGAVVVADYAGIVWGAEETFDDSYSRGAPSMFSLSGVVQGWSQGIPGHAIGSRLLLSIPSELGYGPSGGNADAGIGPDDTIVFVVDLIEAYGVQATGQADATEVTPAEDLPVTIAGGLGEPATVSVPEGATEPAGVEAIVVAEGSGDPVAIGQSVAVGYATTAWDGTPAGSSWESADGAGAGPYVGLAGQGSIVDALIDVPVGSRVLVLTPAAEGPAYAHVVDILAAR